MAGCFGGSTYDRWLENQVNDYCSETELEFEVTERTIDFNGILRERTYTTYVEDIRDAFSLDTTNKPLLKNGRRSKAKASHFFPRDGVMLVKVGKFVTAVVKEVE